MKYNILSFAILFFVFQGACQSEVTIYQFVMNDIEGVEYSLESLKGKKVMIVNTASKCGLTPQYEQLEELHKTYKDSNFVIIAFPANNFMKQEPGSNSEIADFCQKNYGVSFQMMEKISVKGEDQHPLFRFLTTQNENGLSNQEVKWNFQKFLINENGNLVKVISPRTLPTDSEITDWIEGN